MENKSPEPLERPEEIFPHPGDKTFNALHDKGLFAKKELIDERDELRLLLSQLPPKVPSKGTQDYQNYLLIQQQVQSVKEKVSKKHDELMEILKNEEKIGREIQEKKL